MHYNLFARRKSDTYSAEEAYSQQIVGTVGQRLPLMLTTPLDVSPKFDSWATLFPITPEKDRTPCSGSILPWREHA